jgi:hypothetical protein
MVVRLALVWLLVAGCGGARAPAPAKEPARIDRQDCQHLGEQECQRAVWCDLVEIGCGQSDGPCTPSLHCQNRM